ncbi:MAG: hypothetical protein LBN30_11140, partial [Oscillospiraceae bacterium]|nr:hypothetical protein [Oscillospiraceae bacterium]
KIVNRYYAVPLKALAERASVDLQSIELYANESQTDALSIVDKFKLSAVTSMFMRVLSKYTETIPQWVEL